MDDYGLKAPNTEVYCGALYVKIRFLLPMTIFKDLWEQWACLLPELYRRDGFRTYECPSTSMVYLCTTASSQGEKRMLWVPYGVFHWQITKGNSRWEVGRNVLGECCISQVGHLVDLSPLHVIWRMRKASTSLLTRASRSPSLGWKYAPQMLSSSEQWECYGRQHRSVPEMDRMPETAHFLRVNLLS
jgi:hypothetical protein